MRREGSAPTGVPSPGFCFFCHRKTCLARCGDLEVQIATVAVGALFRLFAGARTAGESFAERARLPQVFLHQGPAFSVIANLAWQGVAIPKQKPSLILRLPQPLTLLRNDMAGISIDLELTTRDSLLARRASQSLAGERSEACLSAASWRAPDRDEKRRVAAGRVSRVPFSFPSFFWASKRKMGAAAHPPLSKSVRREATQSPVQTARLSQSQLAPFSGFPQEPTPVGDKSLIGHGSCGLVSIREYFQGSISI